MMNHKIVVVVATGLTIFINILANLLPINNKTTAELSDAIPSLFTPAGYVFSIWGIIYIGLIAYSVYRLRYANDAQWIQSADVAYLVSAVANMVWIVLWHYELVEVSLVVMLVLLGALLYSYRKLQIGEYEASGRTKWMVHIPFSIYLGWISVATIANAAAALVVNDVNMVLGINAVSWTAIMVVVAGALASLMISLRRDVAFVGVIVWALIGIAIAQSDQDLIIGAVLATVIILLVQVLNLVISRGTMKLDADL